MFSYDFSLGDAYVQPSGFSNVLDNNAFQYSYQSDLSKVSTVTFIRNSPSDTQIHITVLNESGVAISGTEEFMMDGPCMKSIYTFTNPLPSGTIMKFKISSSLTAETRVDMCSLLITE